MKAVIIIAWQGFQNREYAIPKQIMEKAGIATTTASKNAGECHGALGGTTIAELSLRDVAVSDFDIIMFVGGPGAVLYQHDAEAHRIACEAIEKKKLLTAICIAPTILAYAGVLRGKKATVWNEDGQQDKVLTQHSAAYTGDDVTVDGNIITANGPGAAEKFGMKIIEVAAGRNS